MLTVWLHLGSSQQVGRSQSPSQRPSGQSLRQTAPLPPWHGGCGQTVLSIAVGGASRLVLSQVAFPARLAQQIERVASATGPVKPAIVIDSSAAVATSITTPWGHSDAHTGKWLKATDVKKYWQEQNIRKTTLTAVFQLLLTHFTINWL